MPISPPVLSSLYTLGVTTFFCGAAQLQRLTVETEDFSPWFIVWFNTLFNIPLLIAAPGLACQRSASEGSRQTAKQFTGVDSLQELPDEAITGPGGSPTGSDTLLNVEYQAGLRPSSADTSVDQESSLCCASLPGSSSAGPRWVLCTVAPLAAAWLCTYACYTSSLVLAPPSIVVAVFSTSPVWVYIVEVFRGERPPLAGAVLAIVVMFTGVVCVTQPWESSADARSLTTAGVLALLAGAGAASYELYVAVQLAGASIHHIFATLGGIGVLTLVLGWPLWLIPQAIADGSADAVVAGASASGWGLLVAASVAGLLGNVIIAAGAVRVSPFAVALGSILGVPANAAIDASRGAASINVVQALGMSAVCVGFLALLWAQIRHQQGLPR